MPLPGSRHSRANHGRLPAAEAGTPLAIYTSSKSGTACCNAAAVRSWGGARNRADRVTYGLSAKQVADTIDAAATAWAIGLPLTRHITIHWERAGVPDDRAAAATGALLKLASQFLQKRGHRFAYLWVRENDDGDGSKGSHVHILAHIPLAAASAFTGMQRRWLRRVTGRIYRAGVIRTTRIGRTLRAATATPEAYGGNLASVVAYLVKGASDGVAGGAGRVVGKRSGRSQNVAIMHTQLRRRQ